MRKSYVVLMWSGKMPDVTWRVAEWHQVMIEVHRCGELGICVVNRSAVKCNSLIRASLLASLHPLTVHSESSNIFICFSMEVQYQPRTTKHLNKALRTDQRRCLRNRFAPSTRDAVLRTRNRRQPQSSFVLRSLLVSGKILRKVVQYGEWRG